MALEPKHAGGMAAPPEPASDSDTAKRRKVGPSRLEASSPIATDRSLDAFIARANEALVEVDVAPFKSENREGLLRRELEVLQAQLAKAEARANKADMRAAVAEAREAENRRSPRWGLTIAAFVIGGAAMFAVSFFMPGKDPPASPAVTSPAAVMSPTVTPIATPTVTPIAPATSDVALVPVRVPDHVAPPPSPEKITKKPAGKPVAGKALAGKPVAGKPGASEVAPPAPKPPEDDLYNPF